MKYSLRIAPVLAVVFFGQSFAQEVKTAPLTTMATIPSRATDADPIPAPPVVKPDFQIESTQVKLFDVVESPPMHGLPPVEGTITLKTHNVTDPGLPDPPPPVSPLPVDNPQLLESLTEMRENYQETHIVFVSAMVYDHSRTLLRCHMSGKPGVEVTAWSNIDFNHFCGHGSFEASGADSQVRSYFLFVSIGNENTELRREWLASKEIEYKGPEIPVLPDGAPAFVIQSEEKPDPAALTLIEDLHALYRSEGTRMAEAAAARQKDYEERKAYLLANPPKPKDVTVHFWKRDKSATSTEGGQP